ncbi:hypothetical protein GGTG_07382 [Gaeumannomyces tritici R3-111a-1]|uniref:Uncharacterized protein n=1 Tax=Gaeumannomyces tritici (strain R3-111a-1) TaxID=644352 RepID=J3P1I5_GAET3|nr:hypothetical protein GGTG_07382 [Gaeumannomyces tritici R3-111a-1]EJT77470.1 hypothetical protein GGTG_07382 [Gaeumannomyces tritici R3-111a-1]
MLQSFADERKKEGACLYCFNLESISAFSFCLPGRAKLNALILIIVGKMGSKCRRIRGEVNACLKVSKAVCISVV